ncbi:MAG: DUF5947 family protein [Candidatus Dormibacteria bacterium]
MTSVGEDGAARTLATLRQYVRRDESEERCDLCSEVIRAHPRHEHLLERDRAQVACTCTACAVLFPVDAERRYLRVPRDVYRLDGFIMTEDQWDQLAIPVRMAYIQLHTTSRVPRAFYPSPAGATESLLSLDGWDELVRTNPSLHRLQPGVEALLINRIGEAREHYIVPIDRCFELVGLIRVHWRGLGGGQDAWKRVNDYLDVTRSQSHAMEASAVA